MAATDAMDAPASGGNGPILEIDDLKVYFPVRRGALKRAVGYVRAVDAVTFDLAQGRTLGLVGESGCGKSTLGRAIAMLHRPTAGRVLLEGQDMATLRGRALTAMRRRVQMIFQDPYASLNPRMKVCDIVGEGYRFQFPDADWRARALEMLEVVGLGAEHMDRYPHEFSGGQRQRIGIARALSLSPNVVIADEPVSALDVSIQAQVINLLDRLKAEFGFSFLFISHDLSVVEHIADEVAVMYLGEFVERASDVDIYTNPLHPYTQALMEAAPRPEKGARHRHRTTLEGDVPSPMNPPRGCRFHTRCPKAMPRCAAQAPALREVAPGHRVACFLHHEVAR